MFNPYESSLTQDLCIICGERPGTISTADGQVCARSIPRDLLPNARQRKASDGGIDVIFGTRPDLRVTFRTVHGSKGLQADYVFIINCRRSSSGFPNRLDDPPSCPCCSSRTRTSRSRRNAGCSMSR